MIDYKLSISYNSNNTTTFEGEVTMNIMLKNLILSVVTLLFASQAWADETCDKINSANTFGHATFIHTCNSCTYTSGKLSAYCENSLGTENIQSELVAGTCMVGVKNHNGQLTCEQLKLNSGSFRNSCDNIKGDGTRISAACKTRSQNTVRTTIELKRCKVGELENIDGYLTCINGDGTTVKGAKVVQAG